MLAARAMGGLLGDAEEVARLERIFADEVAAGTLEPFARPVTWGPPKSWPTSAAAASGSFLKLRSGQHFCAARAAMHVEQDIRAKVPGVAAGEPCCLPRRPHVSPS